LPERPEELPEGWRASSLTEIANFLNGIALQKFPPENETDYLPVIKIRELKAGITDQTDKASKNIGSKYIVDTGDILFSWSGSLEVVIWQF
jgi:type I restriction enzyme S subunit